MVYLPKEMLWMDKENIGANYDIGREMQYQPQETQNEVKEYKREDCEAGVIVDIDEIEELIRNQKIDILQNALLGEYAQDGTYVLGDEVKDELLKAKKVITNNYENYIFAQTLQPIENFGVGKFYVNVSKLDDKLIATLTFVEPVYKMNKLVTNTQSSLIAMFVDKAGEKYYFDMKKEFNIVDDDYVYPDEKSKKEFNACIKIKKRNALLWKESVSIIEKTEKQILDTRVKVLSKSNNEYAKTLLDLFNTEVKKRGTFFSKCATPSLCMNQLMNDCISILDGKFGEKSKTVLKEIYKSTKQICNVQKKETEAIKTIVVTREQKESIKTKPAPKKEVTKKSVEIIGSAVSESEYLDAIGQFNFGKDEIRKDTDKSKRLGPEPIGNFVGSPKEKSKTAKQSIKDDDGMSM